MVWISIVALANGIPGAAPAVEAPRVEFAEVATEAGVAYDNQYLEPFPAAVIPRVAGGIGAGDYDGDGWVDLFGVRANAGANLLLRNQGDGTFVDTAAAAGLTLPGEPIQGPAFADYDGDGALDLFLGATDEGKPKLFRNRNDGTFALVPDAVDAVPRAPYNSATFGDFDRDGDLDLLTTHWGYFFLEGGIDHLWRNNGNGTFTGATSVAGLTIEPEPLDSLLLHWSFCANFADVSNDGWPDLLLASDFGRSQVFLGNGDGTFRETTTDVISDENGMGSAVGDYDNDGDLDWFVSSIYLANVESTRDFGTSGNRLYRNRGDGSFEDATDEAGVRDGSWGWGSCFADFDNDGFLDLFHVNGWDLDARFEGQAARLFMSNRDGTFTEEAELARVADRGNGRGVVCFDYDRDGDIDIFVANNGGSSRLFRNDTGSQSSYLGVSLIGRPPNTEGIGARITVTSSLGTQIREIRSGCNYVSQDPAEAHFGLGSAIRVAEVRVRWLDGTETVKRDVAANRVLRVARDVGDANCDGRVGAADVVRNVSQEGDLPRPFRCPLADVDEDGRVDAADRAALVRLVFVD